MAQISLDEGTLLVRTARKTVYEFLKHGRTVSDASLGSKFSEKSGVFVTLCDKSGLRGCIGYPLPDRELYLALRDAAIAAATQDPRFFALKHADLVVVTFEVTILTPPEKILVDAPEQYLDRITVGTDGLIVSNGPYSGLLLPQVPSEYGWDSREFLEHTCQKAGLPNDSWKDHKTQISKFQGTVFREQSPNGNVILG